MSYIIRTDITDNIASDFDLTPYIDEAENEINDLAQRNGVATADIETDPLHYKVKRYAVCFALMRLCQDKMGTNNIDIPSLEKYSIKYDIYLKELKHLREEITYEVLTGNILELRDRAVVSGTLFRG
jgi:hypothetical protein